MAFNIKGARAAGYDDSEIAEFLGKDSGFDAVSAQKAGYSPQEIVDHIASIKKPSELAARGLVSTAPDSRARKIAELDEETDPSNPNYLPITKNAQSALRTDAKGGMDAKRTKSQGRVLDADVPGASVGSVIQDIGAGALQIIPTVAKGVGDITRMATGDRAGKGLSDYAEESMSAARGIVGSDRAAAQKKRFEQDMQDQALNPADLIVGNPGAISDMILPTVGSMVLPIGAAAAASAAAKAGNAAKLAAAIDPATVAARAASASGAAVIATTAAQNAADTFGNILEKGGSKEDAYRGAVIAGGVAALVGKATGGGAEGALSRAIGSKSIMKGAIEVPKAMAKEAGQEVGEQVGGSLGELSGNGEMFDANKFGKEVALAGTLGAVVGGGANAASQAAGFASDRLATRQPTLDNKYPIAPYALPGVPPAPVDPVKAITDPTKTIDESIAAARATVQSTTAVDNVAKILQEQGLATPPSLMNSQAPLASEIAAVTSQVNQLEVSNAQDIPPAAQVGAIEQPAISAPAALDPAPAAAAAGLQLPAVPGGLLVDPVQAVQSDVALDAVVAGKKKEPADQRLTPVSQRVNQEVSSDPQPGQVGGMYAQGETPLTASGRPTSPFPKVEADTNRKVTARVKAVDNWLMQNAVDEANSRGDGFNAAQFQTNLAKPQKADKDSAEEYLFGGNQPPVQKPFLKPLVANQNLIPVSKRAPDQEIPAQAAPEIVASAQIGQKNIDLAEGGKPFKTNLDAKKARKLNPVMRVVRVEGGFALIQKTDKQLAAEEKNARRLRNPRMGLPGNAIAAHEFIAGKGMLSPDERADMGMEGNVRIGNRFLFASKGNGLTITQAAEYLYEEGYLQDEDHQAARDLIKRSLTNPQYTPEGVERMAEKEAVQREADFNAEQEALALAQEAEDNHLADAADAYEAAMLDYPADVKQSDMDRKDAFLAMGFTEQEYQDAIAEESPGPQSSGQAGPVAAEVAARSGAENNSGRKSAPSPVQSSASPAVKAPRPEALIELRTRKSVLESLKLCMGGA